MIKELALILSTAVVTAVELGLPVALADVDLEKIAIESVQANRAYSEKDIVIPTNDLQTKPYTYGVPDDDFELTAIYADQVLGTGEAGGFDTFNAVNPGDPMPGKGLVTSMDLGSFWERLTKNDPTMISGRIILGDRNKPYYLGERQGNVDNDFTYIIHLKAQETSEIILHGSPGDYNIFPVNSDKAKGTAIFYTKDGKSDLIAFILGETLVSPKVFKYTDLLPPISDKPTISNGLAQFGTANATLITATKVDSEGNIYASGYTNDPIPGATGKGKLFLVKYSPSGDRLFAVLYGSGETKGNQDYVFDLKVDPSSQAIYTTGRYFYHDIKKTKEFFVAKFDMQSGKLLSQGVFNGPNVQFAGAVAVDDEPNGFVYATGIWAGAGRPDPVIVKLAKKDLSKVVAMNDSIFDGMRELWGGLTYYKGTLYATGWTLGSGSRKKQNQVPPAPIKPPSGAQPKNFSGGRNAWVASFDADSLKVNWITTFGAPQQDWAWDVDTDDEGNIYAVGHTYGKISQNNKANHSGKNDAFLIKIEPNGKIAWSTQWGTNVSDSARNIVIEGDRIFVSGHTHGSLFGTNQGRADGYIAEFDLNGNRLRGQQFGTEGEERAFIGVNKDFVAVGGLTEGSLVTKSNGWVDAYLLKIGR